jgi:hypothetical protein
MGFGRAVNRWEFKAKSGPQISLGDPRISQSLGYPQITQIFFGAGCAELVAGTVSEDVVPPITVGRKPRRAQRVAICFISPRRV